MLVDGNLLVQDPGDLPVIAGGLSRICLLVVLTVYRIAQASPESLHVANADVLKTSPQRYVCPLCRMGGRTGGKAGGIGMDGRRDVWMLIPPPIPPGPTCRQNSPPFSLLPMRRSSSSSRRSRTLAARTATSRCFPTSGSGGPTVSGIYARPLQTTPQTNSRVY